MEPHVDEEAAERGDVYSEMVGSKKPRRRLSSILKGQRTPVTAREEFDKAVEKRLSRRVSFAPANKVLLFSDDLDTLSSPDDADKRLQVAITDTGAQPLTDMETFLNDPPAAQQRTQEKFGVYCDTQDDYGERTMMFSGDCAGYMDMTQCHTVLIDDDDLGPHVLSPEYNVNLPTRGNLDFTFSISKGEAETLPPVKIPSSDRGLPPESENVFAYPVTKVVHNAAASLQEDQTRDQGADVDPTAFFLAKIRMRRSAVDKENQPPIFTSTMMEQPQGQSSNVEKASNVFEAEFDTEFTTSQTRAGQSASKDCIGMEGTRHITAQSDDMDITRSRSVAIEGRMFPTVRPLRLSFKTTANTTISEFDMDMTRSQTVAINAEEVYPHPIKNRKSLAFVTSSNTTCSEFDMDMTRSQTVAINAEEVYPHPIKNRKSLAFLTPSKTIISEFDMDMTGSQTVAIDAEEVYPHPIKNRKSLAFVTPSKTICSEFDMDMTRSQTVAINAEEVYPHPIKNRKSLAFVTSSNTTIGEFDMDMTRSQTVAIDADEVDPHPIKNRKSLAFVTPANTTCSEFDMDMTRSQTVAINAEEVYPHPIKNLKSLAFMTSSNTTISEFDMDMTRSQTVAINAEEVYPHPIKNRKSLAFVTPSKTIISEFDMDMTGSQTVAIDAEEVYPHPIKNRKSLAFVTPSKTSCSEFDMDMTRSQTVAINAEEVYPQPIKNRKSLAFVTPSKTIISEFDMDMTRSQTVAINAEEVYPHPIKNRKSLAFVTPSKTIISEFDMDLTGSQTVEIDAKEVYPHPIKNRKSLAFVTSSNMTCNEFDRDMTRSRTVDVPAELDDMSMTICQTVSIGNQRRLTFTTASQQADDALDDGRPKHMTKEMEASTYECTADHVTEKSGNIDLPSVHPSRDQRSSQARGVAMRTLDCTNNSLDGPTERDKVANISLSASVTDACEMARTKFQAVQLERLDAPVEAACHGREMVPLPHAPESEEMHQRTDPEQSQASGPTALHNVERSSADAKTKRLSLVDLTSKLKRISLSIKNVDEEHRKMWTMASSTIPESHSEQALDTNATKTISLPVVEPDSEAAQNDCPTDDDGGGEAPREEFPGEDRSAVTPLNLRSKRLTPRLSMGLFTPSLSMGRFTPKLPQRWHHPLASSTVRQGHKFQGTHQLSSDMMQERVGDIHDEVMPDWALDTEDLSELLEVNAPQWNGEERQPLRGRDLDCDFHCDILEEVVPGTVPRKNVTTPEQHDPQDEQRRPSIDGIQEMVPSSVTDGIRIAASGITTRPIDTAASGITTRPIDTAASGITTRPIDTAASGITTLPIDTAASGITTLPIDTAASGITTLPIDTAASGITTQPIDTAASGITTQPIDTAASGITTQPIDTAASGITTQSIDYSSSHGSSMASLGSEAAAESSYKSSLTESYLEDVTDWGNTLHKKLEDDNMTVLKFFKCFGVDFAFYNHRQSVTPANLASDLDCKPEDLLRRLHIDHPKWIVYENDHTHLAETMEGLQVRMRDNHLVRNVNGLLWKALRDFSDKELQCFGAKLKEKSKFFRRRAKVQSHEMKGVLYSTLHHAYQEELLKLREKNTEADKMVEVMDDCIHDLKTSLDAVEGNDLNSSGPTLAARRRELEKVNTKLADGEREMCELELQNKQKTDKLSRLRAETGHLHQRSTTLEMLNEWKLKEETGKHAVFTFVYNTMHLDVEFEEAHGDLTDERNISNITLTLVQLDDKKSKCHARLVHKLLSQYIEANSPLKDEYPTRRHVPRLLHSVSVTAARLCLLGMEVDLMAKWGAQRLNLLEISCEDTRVCLLFSSLKAFAKFQLSVEVTPGYPLCAVRLCSFTNCIGSTTRSQIEELVGSVEQGKNMLTKIVKRINDTLLC